MRNKKFHLRAKIWEMCDTNNIGFIFFKLGRSKLSLRFSIFNKDECYNFHGLVRNMCEHHFHPY